MTNPESNPTKIETSLGTALTLALLSITVAAVTLALLVTFA